MNLSRFLSSNLIFILTVMAYLSAFAPAYAQEDIEESDNEEAESQVRYISDDLYTYLRSGPGNQYRLLGSVSAGTKIQLIGIEQEAGYAEIIDDRQRTGWVEIKFVSQTPSIREKLEEMKVAIANKDETISFMQKEVDAITENLKRSDLQKAALNRTVTAQLEDIAELNESIEKRERANNMQWFTRGTILAIISIVIGYILGLVGRKNKSKDRLI